jgi:hypothetical protein
MNRSLHTPCDVYTQWIGANNGTSLSVATRFTTLAAVRLSERPTAIGRNPPPFLSRASSRPPKKSGLMDSGIVPLITGPRSELTAERRGHEPPSIETIS